MSKELLRVDTQPLVLHLQPILQRMNDREFFEFCQLNPELRMERTREGDLIITTPTGGQTGRRNFMLAGLFFAWVESTGTGVGFDSSTGFTLPNGARRSPDLAWVRHSRWAALKEEDKEEFPPLCPDFVVELRSRSDDIDTLKTKMQEYMANGAVLGWLIDPAEKKVYIYQPSAEVTCLVKPKIISGDPVLAGFILDLKRIWQ
ncbi:MAG: Uma2 family endonuclease [Acidobacteria bacterium]|nr:Uma2 family endonuclease [Acidobacteriota bacterium]MBI3655701.1 Uma2 family endonuclease [Acidobacteriota bacterium]